MAYITPQMLRDEGVASSYTDLYLEKRIARAQGFIEATTRKVFERITRTMRLDGTGTATLALPMPLWQLTDYSLSGVAQPLGTLVLPDYPLPNVLDPSLLQLSEGCFPEGRSNVSLSGEWGWTTPDGETPEPIQQATILLVLRTLAPLGSFSNAPTAQVTEEITDGHSYKLADLSARAPFTGDFGIDALLLPYAPAAEGHVWAGVI